MEAVEALDYMRDAEPAPGRLELVQRFVNTVDFEHGREVMHSPERLRRQLVELDLLDPAARVGRRELTRALELREQLRALALANNGGDEEVYIGSADLMHRNLDRRVEVIAPVKDPRLKKYLKEVLLDAYLRDTVKARALRADSTYARVEPRQGEEPFNVQDSALWTADNAPTLKV